MKEYLELGAKILDKGRFKGTRTGVSTIGLFGEQMRFDLQNGFPLVTTKRTIFKPMIAELLWFLEGSTDNERLHELGAKFWDQWALKKDIYSDSATVAMNAIHEYANGKNIEFHDALNELIKEAGGRDTVKDYDCLVPFLKSKGFTPKPTIKAGELGPIYGKQWRDFNGVDQITNLINDLKNKPYSRRHIVSAWNPTDLADDSVTPEENIVNGKMALSPCHCLFQFYVEDATFDEQMKHMVKLFSHEVVLEAHEIVNNIFYSEHVKEFVEIQQLYMEENKTDSLPYSDIKAFAESRGITTTVFKVIESNEGRIKYLEHVLDDKSFQEFVARYHLLKDTNSPDIVSFNTILTALLDSYEAVKCLDDYIKPLNIAKCKTPQEMREYCTEVFKQFDVPTKRLSCQLYQR